MLKALLFIGIYLWVTIIAINCFFINKKSIAQKILIGDIILFWLLVGFSLIFDPGIGILGVIFYLMILFAIGVILASFETAYLVNRKLTNHKG